jgi:hypothetical protein
LSDILGLLLLAVYIVSIMGLAAVITFAVVKIFPTQRTPKKPDGDGDHDEPPPSKRGAESTAGSLFRRSKRAAT